MSLRCVVADDHPAIVAFLRDYLKGEGFEVVGTATDGEDAAAKVERLRPDFALVDIRMPRLSGIEIAKAAARASPSTAVIIYTAFADETSLHDALDAGVRGIVQKDAPFADLKRAIDLVMAGSVYVDPSLGGRLAQAPAGAPIHTLTQRERDVLRLLAQGLHNEQIGQQLFISPETVRTHLRKAMTKLGAETRTQAVATALRESLIS